MKHYLDTEFLEGTQKKKFLGITYGHTKPTIDLISIGIVSEDNREYYAVSKDFNLKEAWNRFQMKETSPAKKYTGIYEEKVYWIRENVLRPIFDEWQMELNKQIKRIGLRVSLNFFEFNYKNFKYCIDCIGKTNKQISEEIKEFIYAKESILYNHEDCKISHIGEVKSKIKFYAYFADYDWVVFCQLFGTMMDLPIGFPMYCIDLKQELDNKENSLRDKKGKIKLVSEIIPEQGCAMAVIFDSIKDFGNYPKQENKHNALSDARWNKKLHEFIKQL